MKHPGFTLAELLIALALLGIIAAFTIPKVLQSSAENERVAKLRETVSVLEQSWYNLKQSNQLKPGNLYTNNLKDVLNVVSENIIIITYIEERFTLANGVEIRLHHRTPTGYDGDQLFKPQVVDNVTITIDINNSQRPNQPGQDIFYGTFNPWGDFDVNSDVVYTFGETHKNFLWGNASESVYDNTGGIHPGDSPEARVGTWLTK